MPDNHLSQLIRCVAGDKAADDCMNTLHVDRHFTLESAGSVSRSVFAMALNALLFHDLLKQMPTGAAYVADRRRLGERIVFDHSELRTIRFAKGHTGKLPAGFEAFARILEPLGYHVAATHHLDLAHVTARSFAHRWFPDTLPQFFVRELHVERFSPDFQAAAGRVFGTSRDPLTANVRSVLADFAAQGRCDLKLAAPALRDILDAFSRSHDTPTLSDYQVLLAESPECAGIATEGYAVSHLTERVADVAMTACAQRSLGRPVKSTIETSAGGSVRQTAFKADTVARPFRTPDGEVELNVPGAFYEFISRDVIAGPDGKQRLDLRFDTSKVHGTFKMAASH